MKVAQARDTIILLQTVLAVFSFITLLFFALPAQAEYNLSACSCAPDKRGSCSAGQGCVAAVFGEDGYFCHANPAGGYPLNECGEGCRCGSTGDCAGLAFGGMCIRGHCYARVNGIFVRPLECQQQKAAR